MKSILFLIIYVLAASANLTYAQDYSQKLPLVPAAQKVSTSRISEAKLLESYTSRYKEKLGTLYAQYSSIESLALKNAYMQLDEMSQALERIQTKSVSEKDATQVMQSIVEDIKVLNIRMKVYLEQEKLLMEEKLKIQADIFIGVGNKISLLLESFIEKMTNILIKKPYLSVNDTNIIRSLVKIRDENKKIKEFSTISFSSEEEMRLYYQNIIENIRKEMRSIKSFSAQ